MAIKRGKKIEKEFWWKGKRICSRLCKTKREADEWYHDMLLKYSKGEVGFKEKDYTLEELFDKYQSLVLLTKSPNTQDRYQLDLARLREHFRFYPISKVTPEMVLQFRADLIASGALEPKSINMCVGMLKTVMNFGIQIGWVKENPVKLKPLELPKRKYKWWERMEEIQTFLRSIKGNRYEAALRLALECGLRQGEVVGLSKQDIDFERGQIYVWRQWLRKKKSYGPVKGKKPRYIGLDPDSDLLELLREEVRKSPDEEIVFTTSTGHRVDGSFLYEIAQEKMKRHHLPVIKFHDLRHTFASWFMIRGGSLWNLMEILGHSNIQMTMKYAHLSSDVKRVPSFNLEKSPEKSRNLRQLQLVK